MRLNLILLFFVVAAGIGLSLLLIPNQRDVALLQLRSNNVEAARETLNERLAAGDTSVAVIASLAKVAMHDGDIDRAVEVMEAFLRRRPNDIGARRALAEYYRFAQRQTEFVETLEQVALQAGTAEEWRRLIDYRRFRGEFPELRFAIDGAIERGFARPSDYLAGAELAANYQEPQKALDMLERMWRDHPASFNQQSVKQYAMIAGSFDEVDRAVAAVKRFADASGGPMAAQPIIREAADRDQHLLGLKFLALFDDNLADAPPLLVLWARMQSGLNRDDLVRQRLEALEKDGALPDLAVPVLLDVALRAQDLKLITRLLVPRKVGFFNDARQLAVADTAVGWRDRKLTDIVRAQMDPDLQDLHPALMARLAIITGDLVEGRRLAEVAVARSLRADERLRLAQAWFDLGEEASGQTQLSRVIRDPVLSEETIRRLARVYVAQGRIRAGLAVFDRLRQDLDSDAADVAWVRLATQAGEDRAVEKWLERHPLADPDLLESIVELGRFNRAPRSALAAATMLRNLRPGRATEILMAQALSVNDRNDDALRVLQPLMPGGDEEADAWVTVLSAARRSREALAFLDERRQTGQLSPGLADEYLSLAISLGQNDAAYAELARQDPGQLSDGTLAFVAETAAGDGNLVLVDRLIAAVGSGFLEARPVTAGRVALARGDRKAAVDWASRAAAQPNPSRASRLELVAFYNELGDPSAALALLEQLAEQKDLPAEAIVGMADLYLSLGRAQAGLERLRAFHAARTELAIQGAWARLETRAGDPVAVGDWLASAPVAGRQLLEDIYYLASESGAGALAMQAAERLHQSFDDAGVRRIYGQALIERGRPEDAIPVLKALLPGSDVDAEAYVTALAAAGRKPEALAFLRDRDRESDGALSPRIADDLMALAIELDQPEIAYAEARRQNPRRLPPDTIASLVENATGDGRLDLVDWLVSEVGEDFLKARPVLAARIAVARGRETEARDWVRRAEQQAPLPMQETLGLARVLGDLGENDKALALLETVARRPDTPPYAIANLATLYLELGKAAEGLPLLRELKARRKAPQVAEGWARLESRAGDPAAVTAWLQATDTPGRQALTDVFYLTAARRDAEKAARQTGLLASGKLMALYPGDEARLIRGRALTAVGRGAEAVEILRPLLPGTREVRSAYIAALGRGGNADDLKQFAQNLLADPALEPDMREALLFSLLDAGQGDIALPALRDLAQRDPEKWEAAYLQALRLAQADKERTAVLVERLQAGPPAEQIDLLLYELLDVGGPEPALPFLADRARALPDSTWPAAYEEALATLGRRDELVAWLVGRATDTGLPVDARRNASFRLLDLGAKAQAERGFAGLADKAAPDSPDVQQLVFLWGPRPPEHGVKWLAFRAQQATDSVQKAAWLRLLNDVGASAVTAQIASAVTFSGPKDPVLRPYVESLLVQRQFGRAGEVLGPMIDATDDTSTLLRIADWSEQAGQQDLAVRAYDRVLDRIGDDPEKLLRAGRAFTFAGRAEKAIGVLERFLAAIDGPVSPDGPLTADQRARWQADHRPWYYFGQSLSALNRQAQARAAYREMLARIEASGAADFETRRMQATGLSAIGDVPGAIGLYDEMVAERPDDRSLLADFVSLLIENERYDRAAQLLGQNWGWGRTGAGAEPGPGRNQGGVRALSTIWPAGQKPKR